MMLMPDPRQLKSSDCAFKITFSGRVAGPAAKLKTRSWHGLDGFLREEGSAGEEGEERVVQEMERGFFEMAVCKK